MIIIIITTLNTWLNNVLFNHQVTKVQYQPTWSNNNLKVWFPTLHSKICTNTCHLHKFLKYRDCDSKQNDLFTLCICMFNLRVLNMQISIFGKMKFITQCSLVIFSLMSLFISKNKNFLKLCFCWQVPAVWFFHLIF